MSVDRNEMIGYYLKQHRKACGMTVQEVCDYLNRYYHADIAAKTIYGWESNQAHPTADMLIIMCELYGITDISCMFNKPFRETICPTLEEEALLLAYRKALPYQPAILALLNPFKPDPWPVILPEPEPEPEPEDTSEPEDISEPEDAAEPEDISEPVDAAEPEDASEPEDISELEDTSEPKNTSEVQTTPEGENNG